MKKQLFLLASASFLSGTLSAKSSADQLLNFETMEMGHKKDWFNFMKKEAAQKADLLERHHTQWAQFGTQQLKKFAALTDCAQKDALFKEKLNGAVALHEKQVAEWRAYCQAHAKYAQELDKKHSVELAAFKKQLGAAAKESKADFAADAFEDFD